MATRRATRKYESVLDFLVDYNQGLNIGSIQLPAGSFRGELANEIKLDLSIPEVGRIGPIKAQVVLRTPDGNVAMRLPAVPVDVHQGYEKAKKIADDMLKPFLTSGMVVRQADHDKVVAEYEEKLKAQEEEFEKKMEEALAAKEAEAEEKIGVLAARMAAQQGASGAAVSTVLSRGFPIPPYESMEPLHEGNIANKELDHFLLEAAAKELTGLLVIEDGDSKRYGYFDRGGPVGWRSDPQVESEVLGVLLYKAKQISKEQLQESLGIMEEKGIRQGEAFIEMGVMSFSQKVRVLGKQVDFVLQQVRKLKSGFFSFYPLENLPERFVPPRLRLAEILFREYFKRAKKASQEEIYREYSKNLNTYLSYSEIAKSLLPTVNFSPPEKRLVEVIQSNSWRMREVFSVSPMPRGSTSAFIWSFHKLGFFDYAQKEDDSRMMARFEGRVSRKIRQLNGGSMFDLLEIHWICLPQEIEDAYKKLDQFFDHKQNTEMPDSLHEDAIRIHAKLTEAYTLLKNDKQRREYRLKIIEKEMIVQSAELLSKKGEMAVMRRDRRDACGCYSKALELIPGNQGYREGLRRAAAVTAGPG